MANLVSKQKRLQTLFRLALHAHRIFSSAHQIAHCLVFLIGHVDRLELPSACQPREFHRVAPIGLYPIGRIPRRHRRRHHHAAQLWAASFRAGRMGEAEARYRQMALQADISREQKARADAAGDALLRQYQEAEQRRRAKGQVITCSRVWNMVNCY